MNDVTTKPDTDYYREYPSAWQRHKANGCSLRCHYCVQRNKFRDLSWKWIPSDRYAAYLDQERRRKLEEQEAKPKRFHSRIILPEQERMIQSARRSG